MAAEPSVIEPAFKNSPAIDWWLLGHAVEHYRVQGYEQVEVPWVIPSSYMGGTKPHDHRMFEMTQGHFSNQPHELIGSAEQGFVYMKRNKLLPYGRNFQAVTPCFRVENFDSTHLPWFMKLELYIDDNDKYSLEQMIEDAVDFFTVWNKNQGFHFPRYDPKVVQYGDTFDIEINGVEVGSYGIRPGATSWDEYIYGTGLALPRLSQARNK